MTKWAWIVAAGAIVLVSAGTTLAQETGSRVDAICCGSSCCRIDGVCYSTGESSPSDACLVCQPSRSQTSFTNTCTGGTDAGRGGRDAGTSGGGGGGAGATTTSWFTEPEISISAQNVAFGSVHWA